MKPETRHPTLNPRPSTLDPRHPTLDTRPSSLDTSRFDLASIREHLASTRGEEYWRCLEELVDSEKFHKLLTEEFSRQTAGWLDGVSRRDFLRLMGASLALAGLGACRAAPVDEKIVPYVIQPEEIVPGRPLFFATAFPMGGIGAGVVVESHEGRPTKIEGNPNHPASLGATDAFAQASILTLYDPDRSQVVRNAGRISTWSAFLTAVNDDLEAERVVGGGGLRILTETVTSPTLANQLRQLLARFPNAKWHQYEPVNRDNVHAGARLAFGTDADTIYRFENADVILSLDADFIFCGPGNVRYARDFADKRRVRQGKNGMNRLYVVETTPSVTGSIADHRFALRPTEILHFAAAIAAKVGISVKSTTDAHNFPWIDPLVHDLQKHRGASVVIAGDQQPPEVHALVHAINHSLGNVGKTVIYTDPIEASPVDQLASLRELVKDMESGAVRILLLLGGNPVYTAPVDFGFAERLANVPLRVHSGLFEDETSAYCHWHIPEAHYLESWSDIRAYDGTATILQPLIAPLYGGKSSDEILAAVLGRAGETPYDTVRNYWKGQKTTGDFEIFWRTALHDGVIAGTTFQPKAVKLKPLTNFAVSSVSSTTAPETRHPTPETSQPETRNQKPETSASESRKQKAETGNPQAEAGNSLEISFPPDPTIFDGRFANNGWLQELPKPLTKLTWDNAALVSPKTAQRLGLSYQVGTTGGEHGRVFADVVELRYEGRTLTAPAWIVPGHADECVTLSLGYGRTRAGKVGNGIGFNAYALRTSNAPRYGTGLEVRKVGTQFTLACTQFHHSMEGRDLVRAATLEEYRKDPNFAHTEHHHESEGSLYPGFKYEGHAWGMSIDVGACIGCNACVVACQAENNIPVVGKTEVTRGREMHWLRIDRYYKRSPENPETYHQPIPCMHCENAPCELVCPVGATNHSHEGLNDMVYNRCVGTRYCSNNCPYKVRRFNFFQYADFETPSLKPMRNPDVTVRSLGVMEKCTYCVQRINAAKIDAEKENRPLRDGEIQTACQAACPTQAIVFGDINNRESAVARLKSDPLNYGLLTELNTKPRTTYLAKLRNPNPEIKTD
ncbi:MAG TPA: TAT-variant-translocated molybdopterin oxidoreductase [Candidatus Binatia bacterium]|nr:TAT-variant-translocated molybdopterin oxidoreductase [Candidatus Binatia bacterium]